MPWICIGMVQIDLYGPFLAFFILALVSSISSFFFPFDTTGKDAQNLKRCLKLINLADEPWFEGIARQFSWQSFADVLDQANSFDELKAFLAEKEPY